MIQNIHYLGLKDLLPSKDIKTKTMVGKNQRVAATEGREVIAGTMITTDRIATTDNEALLQVAAGMKKTQNADRSEKQSE